MLSKSAKILPPLTARGPVYVIPFLNQSLPRANRMHALPTFPCHCFMLLSHSSPKDVEVRPGLLSSTI